MRHTPVLDLFYGTRPLLTQVPASDWEALKSPLLGLFEKRRAAKFLGCVSRVVLAGGE